VGDLEPAQPTNKKTPQLTELNANFIFGFLVEHFERNALIIQYYYTFRISGPISLTLFPEKKRL